MAADPGMAAPDQARHWPFLDLVRAGAALLVMLGHARGAFCPEFAALPAPGPLTKAFYLLTGLQHEGVVLFFLVSGFLVGGSAWESMAAGRFAPLRYLANRFVRIYLVLIPGLALTLAIHALGTTWFADTRSFAAMPAQPWSWAMGICHLASLQGISCSVLVANAPLWSLSYEWLLYLAAPLVLGLGHAPIAWTWRFVALLALAATMASILPAHLQWAWVIYWAMGAGAARLAVLAPLPLAIGAGGLVVTGLGLITSRLHIWTPLATDLLIAAGFAVALSCPAILARTPAPRAMSFLADCSYSLYVIHLPVIMLAVALLQRLTGPVVPGAGIAHFALFAVTAAVAIGAAALFAHVTERHTRRLQRALLASGTPPQLPSGDHASMAISMLSRRAKPE